MSDLILTSKVLNYPVHLNLQCSELKRFCLTVFGNFAQSSIDIFKYQIPTDPKVSSHPKGLDMLCVTDP